VRRDGQALEQQVRELQDAQAATELGRRKDWRAAVEKYTGDEDLLAVFAAARKLREQDRARAPRKPAGRNGKKRKS
jgi:hypothetical protein